MKDEGEIRRNETRDDLPLPYVVRIYLIMFVNLLSLGLISIIDFLRHPKTKFVDWLKAINC